MITQKALQCPDCFRFYHKRCLSDKDNMIPFQSMIILQCADCLLKRANFISMNYNMLPFQQTSLYEQPIQIPSQTVNYNNYENNKKLKNKNNEVFETKINIKDNGYSEEKKIEKKKPGRKKKNPELQNLPKTINLSNLDNNSEKNPCEITVYENEEQNKVDNPIIIKSKSMKPKKKGIYFDKSTLEILENLELTNEDKLLYIIKHYKNIEIDPLILKVLEYRKNNRINCISNNDNQNLIIENKNKSNNDTSSGHSSISENNNNLNKPQPVVKITYPIDDKILFKDLLKYKVSLDILERPKPTKINLEFHILNKLFIIWDFLITFKDIIFVEKTNKFEIDENIMNFRAKLLDKSNNFQYYKSILISLLLICVKNIPLVIQSPKTPRLFLLKSIPDNLHSTSYNIVYDSPFVVLREITECYLYYNSIEENSIKILKNVLKDINNIKNKISFENNKAIYKNDSSFDNISHISNDIKINLLHIIIGLCFETYIIKNTIKNEYEKMMNYSSNKKNLDELISDAEKRLKELNRMENFETLGNEVENLEKNLQILKDSQMKVEEEGKKEEVIEQVENGVKVGGEKKKEENNTQLKEIEELEKKINGYKNLIEEFNKLTEKKKDLKIKLDEIIDKIYDLKTLRKKYLGIDYQNNEYYYFSYEKNKIYIKNKKSEEWGYFDKKEDIEELINKLTEKGKNEKKLKFVLKFILSQIKQKEEKEQKKEEEKNTKIINNEREQISQQNQNKENDNKINDNKINDIKEIKDKENTPIIIEEEKIQPKIEEQNLTIDKSKEIFKINLSETKAIEHENKEKETNHIHIIDDDEEEEEELEEGKEIEESENKTTNKDDKKSILSQSKSVYILNDEHLELNIILIKMDEAFSDYLVQFNKQWESEKNRNSWRNIIKNNPTDINILTSLKLFNHKFKNPYKILSKEEGEELQLKEKINKIVNNFSFEDENGKMFNIPETNNLLLLSPKVKIWSKEMDLIDMDNYYVNNLLINVYSREQLCYVVHFYEMAIFGLVHRREGKRKL